MLCESAKDAVLEMMPLVANWFAVMMLMLLLVILLMQQLHPKPKGEWNAAESETFFNIKVCYSQQLEALHHKSSRTRIYKNPL